MLGKSTQKFIVIFMSLNIVGCSFLNVSNGKIDHSEKKWQAAGVKDYRYSFVVASLSQDVKCETSREGIDVEVRDGRVAKFGNCGINDDNATQFGSVDAMFNTLRKMKSDKPKSIKVIFHEKYGFPESIDVNYSRWFTDHRVQYYVKDFVIE